MRGAGCWGWATWKRAWKFFDSDPLAVLKKIQEQNAEAVFNHNGNYDYTGMLKDAATGRVSSWAIRWLASTWLADMYTLYPSRSLVNHDGSDGTGTHCLADRHHDVELSQSPVSVSPMEVWGNAEMTRAWSLFLRQSSGGRWPIFKHNLSKNYPQLYNFLRTLKNI